MALRENTALADQVEADIERLVRGVKKAVKDAMRDTVQMAEEWKRVYFPRDTGQLINMTTIQLNYRTNPFSIQLDCRVDYASYVNAMEDVNWTNILTVEHFWDIWTSLVKSWFAEFLAERLRGLEVGLVRIIGIETGKGFGKGAA